MKKIIKIVLSVLGGVIFVIGIVAAIFYIRYKDWMEFNNALIHNNIVVMDKMIKDGYDINDIYLKSIYDISHLKFAIAGSHIVKNDTIEFLLKNGANPNYPGKFKINPLITSLVVKKPKITEMLINYNASINIKTNDKTLVDMAILTNQPEIIMMIPPEAITMGEMIRKSSVPLERVIRLYDMGKTDNRVLQYLIDNKIFTKKQIEETRKQLSKQ